MTAARTARAAAFGSAAGAVLFVLTGCATLAEKYEHMLTISETSEADFEAVKFSEASGLADYKFGKGAFKAEWIDCRGKAPVATILVMHADKAGFEKAQFCGGWLAQTFLSQG